MSSQGGMPVVSGWSPRELAIMTGDMVESRSAVTSSSPFYSNVRTSPLKFHVLSAAALAGVSAGLGPASSCLVMGS